MYWKIYVFYSVPVLRIYHWATKLQFSELIKEITKMSTGY